MKYVSLYNLRLINKTLLKPKLQVACKIIEELNVSVSELQLKSHFRVIVIPADSFQSVKSRNAGETVQSIRNFNCNQGESHEKNGTQFA